MPASEIDAVRKTVTVLFCDVVGSTAFAEQVDAEAAREAMGQYHSMAQRVVEANGGTVAKFIGDGVMAIWGVPEVAEDDAARAVTCGVALQHGFEAIELHIADRYGIEVGLRVGINTGEVVIADQDADIVGDALNTAARIEAACTPGEVVVGEETWRLTRSAVGYEVLGEVDVKGKKEPVATFQVVEQAVEDDGLATPFVGRDLELGALRDAFDAAVDEQTVQLVTVIGPPGVGKTRLAAELAASLGDAVDCFAVRCEQSSSSAFAPIRDLLLGAARIEPDSAPQEVLASLDALFAPEVRDKDRLVELLGSFVGAAEPRSTEDSFFAMRRTLEVLGSRRPVVLVIDDIQWAEPLLLDLVEHLAEWIAGGAVLIIGLARPEIRDVRASLTEPGRRVANVVSLDGLGAAATEELAARLLGGAALPEGLVARLPDSTEGNPLFVREFVRMLADDGVIVRNGDSYELTIDAEAVEIPPTIQSLLAARVERLPDDERRIVELASVVGSEFQRGALAALAVDYSSPALDAVLERLRRKDFIDPTGTYWGDEPILRFHHVLIRDAAYRRVLKGTRADLHLAIGLWTEETAGNVVGEHEATIAFHYEQTHQYRSELGTLDDETRALGNRAARLLHRAAARALESEDLATAGSLARRALACLDDGDRIRPTILLLACEALASSDIRAARSAVAELAAFTSDARLAAWATCFESQLSVITDPASLVEAAAACETAALTLAGLGDVAGVAKAHQIRAGALARLGRVGECEAELDLALTAARAVDDRRRITAVLGAAPHAALWGPSPVPRAGGRCLDVIRLLRIAGGSPTVEATSIRCQAVLEALRGRFDPARAILDTSCKIAEEFGLRAGLMETELYTGIVEILAGDPAAAEVHLRTAHAGLDRLGIGADAGQAAAYLARSLLLQDKLDEAEQLAVEADEHAGQNLQTAIAAKSARAEILAARGHHEEAVALAKQAVAIAVGTDILFDHASSLAALARVLHTAGRGDDATVAWLDATSLWQAKGASVNEERFAETITESPEPPSTDLVNGASRTCSRLDQAVDANDRATIERLVSDTLQFDVHHGTESETGGSKADFLTQAGSWIDGGMTTEHTPIAVRGDHLVLFETPERGAREVDVHMFTVVEVNDAGLITYIGTWDEDDLQLANDELNRRWLTTLSDSYRAAAVLAIESLDAIVHSDLDWLDAHLPPGFKSNDHRPTGLGDRDRATFMAMVAQRPTTVGDGVMIAREFLRCDEDWVVLSLEGRTKPPSGGGYVSEQEMAVFHFDGDQVLRGDIYPLELPDQALAAAEEIDAKQEPVSGAPVANLATQIVARFAQAGYEERDWAAVAALCHDDLVFEVRRNVAVPGGGRAEIIEALQSWPDTNITHLVEPIAVRGENLALFEQHSMSANGDEVRLHFLAEISPDGLIQSVVTWDHADLDLAHDELTRRWS